MTDPDPLRAILLNCSLKPHKDESHTQRLLNRVAGIFTAEGVQVEQTYVLEHVVATGMIEDGAEIGVPDEWPAIEARILAADILVIGTPIWLGTKSSVATRVIERMYASSGRRNEHGQWLYYGRTAGCVITGNEDGVKHCAMDLLYSLQHIGYVVPPQADCGWIGEAGPGPSYGDVLPGSHVPVGYDNDFTNRNATYMAWNLMHVAQMLRAAGGLPAQGNTTEGWEHVSNARDQNPEYR